MSTPANLHLISAFLAMEPPDVLISLARECGGGFVGERVQSFIWNHCISEAAENGFCQGPYVRRFLKKLIAEIEFSRDVVLDELYEHYALIMTSSKDDDFSEGKSRVVKKISFLFPDECAELLSCPKTKKLEVSLQCSLNMLEGDTGCSIWPSSLFLSEFVLSFPELFFNKSCLEVGSGVGLLGVCLAQVKASPIILSDGNLSTLENMRLNLESNHLRTNLVISEENKNTSTESSEIDLAGLEIFYESSSSPECIEVLLQYYYNEHVYLTEETILHLNFIYLGKELSFRGLLFKSQVQCVYLPWESVTESELQNYAPDVVLGADVIYNPLYLPHLVRVLSILLKGRRSSDNDWNYCRARFPTGFRSMNSEVNDAGSKSGITKEEEESYNSKCCEQNIPHALETAGPVAYIASVIRNIETFNYFLELIELANLAVTDITEGTKPWNLLPYVKSYQRSDVRIFTISSL